MSMMMMMMEEGNSMLGGATSLPVKVKNSLADLENKLSVHRPYLISIS
jgi:hypothetical protein